MFWKKVFFLAAGYALWNVVGSLYGKKNKPTKSQDMKSLFQDFVETQKNFFEDIESRYIPEDKKVKYEAQKKEFLEKADKYIVKGEKLLTELQKTEQYQKGRAKAQGFASHISEKGKQAVSAAQENLKKVNTKKEEIKKDSE